MHLLKLFLLVLAFISYEVSAAQPYKTLVAPLTKDTTTSLYTITLNYHENYVINLEAPLLWYSCPNQRHPTVPCTSPTCSQARSYLSPLCPPSPTTARNKCTCMVTPVNPITKSCALADLTYKNLVISWTNGRNPGVGINFNHLYVACAPLSLLQSLPKGALGVAGLSSAALSLSSQFTPSHLGVTKKFAICLPSSTSARGVIFFGDGPYYLLPQTKLDATSLLSYTALLKNPKSPEYYVGVKAIAINRRTIPISTSSLALNSLGHGGVKLSTVVPYTTLRSDVYNSFLRSFSQATRGIPRAKTVKPFGLCLKTSALIGTTRVGLSVPQIDLELANGKNWTIYGANSMKQVGNDAAYLAFIDGGKTAEQAVVMGSFQMENNFLLFDLARSRLGFSSSLFLARTTCANFNFTTKA